MFSAVGGMAVIIPFWECTQLQGRSLCRPLGAWAARFVSGYLLGIPLGFRAFDELASSRPRGTLPTAA